MQQSRGEATGVGHSVISLRCVLMGNGDNKVELHRNFPDGALELKQP